jgi:hypothetical protein
LDVFWPAATGVILVVDNEVEMGVAGVFVARLPGAVQVGLLDDDRTVPVEL